MTGQPKLGFIGAGKVGITLARLMLTRGYDVTSVYSTTTHRAEILAQQTGAKVAQSASEAIGAADLVFLTVPDDAIDDVVSSIGDVQLESKAIVHTSGAHEASVLEPLAEFGAMIGSLHPIFPFADVEEAIRGLPGAAFGLQAEAPILREWLSEIVRVLDGRSLFVGKGQKALYHSALVFASNYGVTLYAIAQRLLSEIGAEKEVSSLALNTLMAGMIRNLEVLGIPDALTGPLVRGDVSTIEAHLTALAGIDSTVTDLYRDLAMQTLPLAVERGVDTGQIEALLRKKMDDAANHT